VDEAKAAVSESMERKRKLREQKEEIENATIERDSWKTKFESHDDSVIIKERDTYKEKWNGYINTVQDSFNSFYERSKETPAWEKVKSEYIIPEEGKTLTPEEIENNVSKMTYHQKLGLFEQQLNVRPTPPAEKPFTFSGDKAPTVAEYYKIRNEYGPGSYEAIQAMALIEKHKGV
jgi:ATP-dependent Clp protease ATP-binding subunit ClpA